MEASWPRVAGEILDWVTMPGAVGRQRRVLITEERVRHILQRRPSTAEFCLAFMGIVLRDPWYVAHHSTAEPSLIGFVRPVGPDERLLLVAVKFLDDKSEAWVSTAHPMRSRALTRRLRNGTIRKVSRGP